MFTDVGKPSTWIRFRPSLCDDCTGGCCTLPVEVTASDLLRLKVISEDEAVGSLKRPAQRLKKEKIVQSFRAATGLFILAQAPNGACVFLDKSRRCTVYEDRPDVCRKFPTILGPRVGFCPHEKKRQPRK